jgi:hypothetical protein
MVTCTFLDWLWIVLYLILLTGCGVLVYRLDKRSESGFSLALDAICQLLPSMLLTRPITQWGNRGNLLLRTSGYPDVQRKSE